MIVKEFIVRNRETSIAFSGDPSVQWYVEVLESNYSAPTIKSIANGAINLLFTADALQRKYKIAFHTADEKTLVEEIDEALEEKKVFSKIIDYIKEHAKSAVKKIAYWTLGITILSFLFVAFSKMPGCERIRWFSEHVTAGNAANKIEEYIESADEIKMIAKNEHKIYDSIEIKKIEERELDKGVTFPDLFAYIGDGIFLMKHIVVEDGDALMMTQDDAEDKCDEIGAYLPTQDVYDQGMNVVWVRKWGSVIEWTSESSGFMSDDYELITKGNDIPDGAYKQDGKIYSDGDDIKAGFRCMFRASDFE